MLQHRTDNRSRWIRPKISVIGLKALFRLSFIPDAIGAGPGLSLSSTFSRKHVLMLWTVVAIAMGVGLTGSAMGGTPGA